MTTAPQRFSDGAGAFARGWRIVLAHPQLLPWLIMPFVLNLIIYVALVVVCVVYFKGSVDEFFSDRTAWYWTWTGAKYLSWLVYAVVLLFAVIFTFVPVGIVISAPFNEVLSQKTEAIVFPEAPAAGGGVRGLAVDVGLAVWHALLRSPIWLVLFILTLPLRLVPVAGQIVMGYVDLRFLAWDGLDYALARRRMGFFEKWRFLGRHRARTLGLGAVAYVLILVPLTALFVFPMLALSGTLLYCEIKKTPADIVVDSP